ncbi:Leucine-rich repeat protein kinase family protein [Rhynchospora pubera]|uniref:non-specific serine/threonine protein kinase n=1 Tax=Rhynchospora pubera TaxID=906938 RepID=A0AAV8DY54_9POAL|nr:Leucine-rich repeat protein kinase family protein [Rhynchospora pubera]
MPLYPQDAHDRLWISWTSKSWTAISTDTSIDGFKYDVPSLVLQTAAIPSSANDSIDITWSASDQSTSFYVVLHFCDFQAVRNNSLREFDIYANGDLVFKDPIKIDYFETYYVWYIRTGHTNYNLSLKSTTRATLPPIINAIEVYTVLPVTWLPTDNGDVTAINSIKTSYSIRKDWSGDPCVPTGLGWAGVNCSIDYSNIPRITSLNLSASALNGTIISDFGSLIALERLDLSRNNLSGNIPGSLDQLVSLTYLNLSGNSGLSKILPSGLQEKEKDGHLTVIFDGSPSNNVTKKKSSKLAIIVPVVIVMFLIVGAVALYFWFRKKKKNTRINPPTDQVSPRYIGAQGSSMVVDNPKDNVVPEADKKEINIGKKRFSFAELKLLTNNFNDPIGIGGFGEVFKGRLEFGDEVAVKVRSESSSQGIQQFLNEVEKLSRVHHKNLVSLIGYCMDGNQIALVYEYMQKGNLQDWIRGSAHFLPWKQRVRIAYESAQGLEYLHKMCNPPLIHRDIKSSNILLSTTLEAKVSDFGLVRDCSGTYVSTKIVGTPGYLDPYYASTSQLTEKSDVYSFGVVMLEIVTSKSPILQGPQGSQHLTQFVQQRLSRGKIESILDPNMGGQYNLNSVWKVADLALKCTDHPAKRPDMTAIVTQLKEALNLEMSSMETSSVASEDISQYVGYSRDDFPIGGELHSGNFEMTPIKGMPLPDYGPVAR